MSNRATISSQLSAAAIKAAAERLQGIVARTPLQHSAMLGKLHGAEVYLKREDLQVVRSYKIRGAYNKMASLDAAARQRGVVCASAGNHAQGVAYACRQLKVPGVVFMPAPTPGQKVAQVQKHGGDFVEIRLTGDTFDDASAEAMHFCRQTGATFVHPFDDPEVMAGQGTVGLEISEQIPALPDVLLLPVGGGGLAAGVATWFREHAPQTTIIGVEPAGAAAMQASLVAGKRVQLPHIDRFVDGAAVKAPGELSWQICRDKLDKVITVPEGRVCTWLLRLYNEEGMVVEPAGVLTIAALDFLRDEITGKRVACVVSGGNNDIVRTEEIKERSLLYEGLKHYFVVEFPQRAGALRQFLTDVLGPDDDITHFQYSKKNSRERGPAVIGIELKRQEDFAGLQKRLDQLGFKYEYLNSNPVLFHHLI